MQPRLRQLQQQAIDAITQCLKTFEGSSRRLLVSIHKELTERKNALQASLAENTEKKAGGPKAAANAAQAEHLADQMLVYIPLYQTDHQNVDAWYQAIQALISHCSNRPIYPDEAALKTTLGQKLNNPCQAYVCLKVTKTALIEPRENQMFSDHKAQGMLRLKENVLTLDCVEQFVHGKQRYCLNHAQLVLQHEGKAGNN